MPVTVELKNFEYAGKTDKGLVRVNNEDCMGYFDTINGHVFVVSDGMGGHNAGEVASEIAVASVKHFFLTYLHKDIRKGLKEAIEYANKQILEKAKNNEAYNKMGATIAIVIIVNSKMYYAHLGDSRIYIFRRGLLEKITEDHSYIQTLIKSNEITEEQAKTHPRRNEITKALGLTSKTKSDVCRIPVNMNSSDIILICSDGLNSMIDKEQIQEILEVENSSAQNMVNELIETANKNGGFDNVTVQIIKFINFERKNLKTEVEIPQSITKVKKLNSWFRNLLFTAFAVIIIMIVNNLYFNKIYKTAFGKSLKIINHNCGNESIYLNSQNINLFNSENTNFAANIKFIRYPIKTKHKTEIFDEYILLQKKYKININRIKSVNKINYDYILTGKELIIPIK